MKAMKYVDEYRDPDGAKSLAKKIESCVTQHWTIMEVCGGQTHAIKRYALDQMLPPSVELLHGPGCPVCVTPIHVIDSAIDIAKQKNVIFCSFGDMLRVPGTEEDLLHAKAQGADVRMVYSPLDAVKIAEANPQKSVVFFAVGFETTAPANALSVLQAEQRKLRNYSILVSHVLVPPALETILTSEQSRVQGFLAAGHVCTVMGEKEYTPIVDKYRVPIVITGFEPIDILQGIFMCTQQLEKGEAQLQNQYARSVQAGGNSAAQNAMQKVFEPCDFIWRGMGEIPQSGLRIKERYKRFDAERLYSVTPKRDIVVQKSPCISGEILQGIKKPNQCPAFGRECTPMHPLGATMISGEGACQVYYRYR